jgi:hypothetical protein
MIPDSQRPDLRRIGETSLKAVLDDLWSLSAAIPDSSHQDPLSSAPERVTRSVPLTGPRLSGSVDVQLPQAFLVRAVRIQTGLDGAAGEDCALLEDAAGEIANLVAGRVAAGLAREGYPCALGVPSVGHRANLPNEFQPGENHGAADLIWEGHCLSLEVRCRFASS